MTEEEFGAEFDRLLKESMGPWIDPNCHACDSTLQWFDRDNWVCPLCDFIGDDEDDEN